MRGSGGGAHTATMERGRAQDSAQSTTLYQRAVSWKQGRQLDQERHGSKFRKGFTEAELLMRCDMAANKVAWSGDFWGVLWTWTKNTNPIVALCNSLPLHPISRAERLFILFLQLLLFTHLLGDFDVFYGLHLALAVHINELLGEEVLHAFHLLGLADGCL